LSIAGPGDFQSKTTGFIDHEAKKHLQKDPTLNHKKQDEAYFSEMKLGQIRLL